MWGSNPRPSAHKTDALPAELNEIIPAVGFEPSYHHGEHGEINNNDCLHEDEVLLYGSTEILYN